LLIGFARLLEGTLSNNGFGRNEKEIADLFVRQPGLNTYAFEQVNKYIIRQMIPIVNVVTQLNNLDIQVRTYFSVRDQLTRSLSRQMIPNINLLGRVRLSIFDSLAYVFEARQKGRLLEENGWFPHYTMPEEILAQQDECMDFDNQLLSYYRQNWQEVRETLEQNLYRYPVDDSTKSVYSQAIVAHSMGCYDLVPRSLIPEIERIVRMELCHNSVGKFRVGKLICDCFADAPLSIFPDRSFWLIGFEQLTGHIYCSIKEEDTRIQFSKHSIPNRHATLHGLIAYGSEKSSLNSIFIAEYVMQLMTAWKMPERDFP
jgi:hypothetical protein